MTSEDWYQLKFTDLESCKLMWIQSGAWLSFKVEHQGTHVTVDILVNRIAELVNSQLLYTYCKLDSRFREVCLMLKQW